MGSSASMHTVCAVIPLSIDTIRHDFTLYNDREMPQETQELFTYISDDTEDIVERLVSLGYLSSEEQDEAKYADSSELRAALFAK